MNRKAYIAIGIAAFIGLVTSLHAFDLRWDSAATIVGLNYYWLLNLALCVSAIIIGFLNIASFQTKLIAALCGLVVGLVVFHVVMTSRNPDNNLLGLAVIVNFFVGAAALGFGCAVGAAARLARPTRR